MGSGTGFWAALLRASGVDVSCFDVEPPSPEPAAGSGEQTPAAAQNEFHGDCPSFLRVQRGTPAALRDRRWRRHALLLCYPPPQVSAHPHHHPHPHPNPHPHQVVPKGAVDEKGNQINSERSIVREVQSLKLLSHEHIVKVMDAIDHVVLTLTLTLTLT